MPSPLRHAPGCACRRGALRCDASSQDDLGAAAVRAAAERAAFGGEAGRRRIIGVLGAGAVAAALDHAFPILRAQEALAETGGAPEKKDLKVGFIPITCATPIIMAAPMGFYARNGLSVEVVRTAGWAVVRDKSLNGEYDAAHMLSPMPLAISMGAGSNPIPWSVAAIENVNGQAITLANKHKNNRDPRNWKGFKFGIPFDYSMHNYLLRYYLAEAGLDPDRDVQLRAVPPAEMVANLRAENIDGFLGPDPFNQRAVFDGVGFIHVLTRELWDGHPCCAFAVPRKMVTETPNTYQALLRSVIEAAAHANKAENRKEIAGVISAQNYLNQPPTVVEQALTGTYADGLGTVQRVPDRVSFEPFPYQSMALWIMTQMKRWGQVRGDLQWRDVAQQVYLATDAGAKMKELGLPVPGSAYRSHTIMGKTFDPVDPEGYVNSFAIRRT
ncbi:MAG TPA: CmpA/NrtA family ABC transporter substrate-binding protein [Acetobacteraceae bacterium]